MLGTIVKMKFLVESKLTVPSLQNLGIGNVVDPCLTHAKNGSFTTIIPSLKGHFLLGLFVRSFEIKSFHVQLQLSVIAHGVVCIVTLNNCFVTSQWRGCGIFENSNHILDTT